jgi:hypothetical protein
MPGKPLPIKAHGRFTSRGQTTLSARTANLRPQQGERPATFNSGERLIAVANTWQDPHETSFCRAARPHSARISHILHAYYPTPKRQRPVRFRKTFQIGAPWGTKVFAKSNFPGERGDVSPLFL